MTDHGGHVLLIHLVVFLFGFILGGEIRTWMDK
jgi:hypothetical protein